MPRTHKRRPTNPHARAQGIRLLRGKVLASFLKCIGFIIPLMDAMYANYYTREVRAATCACCAAVLWLLRCRLRAQWYVSCAP